MATNLSPDTVKRVTDRIDKAIKRDGNLEWRINWMLNILFFLGLVLLLVGWLSGRGACFVSGGLCEVAIFYPVNKLTKLREDNLLFETFPALMLMADDTRSQELLSQFVGRLIERT